MFGRPDPQPPGIIPDDVRRLHRRLNAATGAMAVAAWGMAAWASSRAPWVADLYHLVNPGAAPQRPESTAAYLFWYPGVLTMLFVLGRFAPDAVLSAGVQDRRVQIGTLLTGSAFALVFLGISLVRALAAASFGG
jgi:hypothetical protein